MFENLVFIAGVYFFCLFCYYHLISGLFLAFGISLGFFGIMGWVGVWIVGEFILFSKKGGKK